jgi:MoaA/NifB/PqqE/SkfB family radical SAM enzyme
MSFWLSYFSKYFWDSRIRGLKKPVLGGFKITHNCNLRCRHCPFWQRKSPELGYEGVVGVMRRLHDMGVRILIFEGGEPFLWRDDKAGKSFNDVVEYGKKLFFSVGVTTNGTMPITDFPADVVWVSFDGLKDTYTKIRGDCFDTVTKNIRESNHENLYANITINRLNEGELEDVVKFLSTVVKGVTIQFHYPYGTDWDKELFIPLNERGAVIERLLKLKKEGYPLTDSRGCLEDMKMNTWQCYDWMLANADPDGTIAQGCYLKNRGEVDCLSCGFAAHVEISKAFDMHLPSINVGRKIFRYRRIDN